MSARPNKIAFAEMRDGGKLIVPGKSAESGIVQRMLTGDHDKLMPPPKSGKKVTPQQIELVRVSPFVPSTTV